MTLFLIFLPKAASMFTIHALVLLGNNCNLLGFFAKLFENNRIIHKSQGIRGARIASFSIVGIEHVTGNENFTKRNNWDPN